MHIKESKLSILRKVSMAVIPVFAVAGLAFAVSASYAASNISTTVTPSSSVYDSSNVVGITDDYAPGFASGSIASDGTGKTDMYFSSDALFGRSVTLGEIASMSYSTKTGETHAVNPADWYLTIYTNPYTGDASSAPWYGDRIGTEPYFSENINDPANTWNKWSTDGSENQLRFFESTAGAPGATFGSYTDPTWSDFIAQNGLSGQPRSSQTLQSISVQTGSAWADGFTGKVDGLTVTLTDGSVAKVNFEANDTTAPDVEVTNPIDGSTVSGTVDVRGTVTDANPDHYYLKISGPSGTVYSHTYPETDSLTNASLYSWDTTQVADGVYTIQLEARDASGNKDAGSVDKVTVTVNNIPDDKDQCKDNGWSTFTNMSFKNQGACVSYVNHNDGVGADDTHARGRH